MSEFPVVECMGSLLKDLSSRCNGRAAENRSAHGLDDFLIEA